MEPQVTEVQEHDAVLVVVRPALTPVNLHMSMLLWEKLQEESAPLGSPSDPFRRCKHRTSLAVSEQEDKLPRMRNSQTIMKSMLMQTANSLSGYQLKENNKNYSKLQAYAEDFKTAERVQRLISRFARIP